MSDEITVTVPDAEPEKLKEEIEWKVKIEMMLEQLTAKAETLETWREELRTEWEHLHESLKSASEEQERRLSEHERLQMEMQEALALYNQRLQEIEDMEVVETLENLESPGNLEPPAETVAEIIPENPPEADDPANEATRRPRLIV